MNLQRVIATRNSQPRNVPVFLKVAPDLNDDDIKSICKTIKKNDTKVDGLIVSNTTVRRDVLQNATDTAQEMGGLSGRPLEKMSTELVGKFYKELKGELPNRQ